MKLSQRLKLRASAKNISGPLCNHWGFGLLFIFLKYSASFFKELSFMERERERVELYFYSQRLPLVSTLVNTGTGH
jgi:hypothetical protein